MAPPRVVRLPLQTGVTCAGWLAGLALFGALPLVIAAVGLHLLEMMRASPVSTGVEEGAFVTAAVLIPLVVTLWVWRRFWRNAWRTRASDVVFEPSGVRIIGGPQDGRQFAWSDVAQRPWYTNETGARLYAAMGDGEEALLATASSPGELASLRDLGLVVYAAAERITGKASPNETPASRDPSVLACSACGAPLAPEDTPTIACHFCRAPTAVPEARRLRIRAQVESGRTHAQSGAIVERMLTQPTSFDRNGLLGVITAGATLLVPVSIALGPRRRAA